MCATASTRSDSYELLSPTRQSAGRLPALFDQRIRGTVVANGGGSLPLASATSTCRENPFLTSAHAVELRARGGAAPIAFVLLHGPNGSAKEHVCGLHPGAPPRALLDASGRRTLPAFRGSSRGGFDEEVDRLRLRETPAAVGASTRNAHLEHDKLSLEVDQRALREHPFAALCRSAKRRDPRGRKAYVDKEVSRERAGMDLERSARTQRKRADSSTRC